MRVFRCANVKLSRWQILQIANLCRVHSRKEPHKDESAVLSSTRARASVASKTFESSSYHQKKEAFWLILQTFGDISHPHKLPFLAPIKARYKSKTMFAFLELFLEYYSLETRKAALLSNTPKWRRDTLSSVFHDNSKHLS